MCKEPLPYQKLKELVIKSGKTAVLKKNEKNLLNLFEM